MRRHEDIVFKYSDAVCFKPVPKFYFRLNQLIKKISQAKYQIFGWELYNDTELMDEMYSKKIRWIIQA